MLYDFLHDPLHIAVLLSWFILSPSQALWETRKMVVFLLKTSAHLCRISVSMLEARKARTILLDPQGSLEMIQVSLCGAHLLTSPVIFFLCLTHKMLIPGPTVIPVWTLSPKLLQIPSAVFRDALQGPDSHMDAYKASLCNSVTTLQMHTYIFVTLSKHCR